MACTSFSKAKAFLILLATVILCASITVLGLSGHGISQNMKYTDGDHYTYVKIRVYGLSNSTSNSTTSTTYVSYAPTGGLGLGDMYALVMSGALGILFAGTILLASMWTGDSRVNISLTGRTVRPVKLLGATATLFMDAALLITFLTTAAYTWTKGSKSSWYLDPQSIATPRQRLNWYTDNAFTFESWNYALAADATPDADPSKEDLYALSQQARVARELVLAIFCVAFLRLVVHFWAWRRHNVAVRLGKGEGFRKSGQERWSGNKQSQYRRSGMAEGFVELPAYRLSRSEAPDGNAVGEMPGEDGSKELAGTSVAVEMEGSEREKT